MSVRTLIAVPTYNESADLPRVLDRLTSAGREILVVDDGSTDGSAELATRDGVHVISHPTNMGYGQSLIDAFNFAHQHKYEWVITMDADGQHEPDSIPHFLELIEENRWDVISGSRYLQVVAEDDLPPPERRDINRRLTEIINRIFDFNITDAFCGFKAHRTSAMIELQLNETGYAFPLQFWPRLCEHRLRLVELPVRRIYHDPNRTFGADLDDARRRFGHYMDVLNVELNRLGLAELDRVTGTPLKSSLPATADCCGNAN